MKLTCYGAYSDGKGIWLPSKEINALYYMSFSDENITYVGAFSDCWNDRAWNIRKVIEYNDGIFFFSMNAYQAWEVDKKTKEIKEYTYYNHPVRRIANIEVIQNKAWIIPNDFSSPIVFFDLHERKGHLFQWDSKKYINYGTGSFTRAIKSGNKLYFATRNKDDIHLCILDCEKRQLSFADLHSLSIVQCIGIKDNKLWVFGENKKRKNVLQEYYTDTLEKKESHELRLTEKLKEKGGLKYFLMSVSAKRILLIPAWAKEIVVYDLIENTEKIIPYPVKFSRALKRITGFPFYEIQEVGNELYFMPHLIPQLLVLNMEKTSFETWNVEVSPEENVKIFEQDDYPWNQTWIRENANFSMDCFCKTIKKRNSYKKDGMKNSIGMAIYRSSWIGEKGNYGRI